MVDREFNLGLKESTEVTLIDSCQGCGGKNLNPFIKFGPMPPPNVYLTQEEFLTKGQISYPLDANLCEDCGLVQLGQIVPSKNLFPGDYAYRTPEAMRADFKESATETINLAGAEPGSSVLEVGSNVGICLQEYQKMGMQVLGVDPAVQSAQEACELGVETIPAPFTQKLAEDIVRERGKMDIITAANVMQHIPDLRGTLDAVRIALSEKGVFTLEFPYLGNILENVDFDTFYAEHYYYLSLEPLQKIFQSLGLTIVHAKKLPHIHCGSMRIFVKHKPAEMTSELQKMIQEEKSEGYHDPARFAAFRGRVNDIMHQINEHLYIANMRGDHVAAHGASAKFVTLTNFGHIGEDSIQYVADSTKSKHGRVTPGMGIPVVPEEKLLEDAPDIVFNGIRNFYDQNKKKYDVIKQKNPKAKILIPIPEVSYK